MRPLPRSPRPLPPKHNDPYRPRCVSIPKQSSISLWTRREGAIGGAVPWPRCAIVAPACAIVASSSGRIRWIYRLLGSCWCSHAPGSPEMCLVQLQRDRMHLWLLVLSLRYAPKYPISFPNFANELNNFKSAFLFFQSTSRIYSFISQISIISVYIQAK